MTGLAGAVQRTLPGSARLAFDEAGAWTPGRREVLVRDGYFARWQDREFEASPDADRARLYAPAPVPGFEQIAAGRWLRVVPAAELGDLYYAYTACDWQGWSFRVIGEQGSWLRVEYAGELPPPDGIKLDSFDRDVYQGWVRRSEVTDLRETRVPA